MISSTLFIGALIIGIVQTLKFLAPNIKGIVTVVVAVVVGIIVALLDTNIGLDNVSIAQGILIGLAAVGTHTTVTAARTTTT